MYLQAIMKDGGVGYFEESLRTLGDLRDELEARKYVMLTGLDGRDFLLATDNINVLGNASPGDVEKVRKEMSGLK